ncbi:MAG: hypothetical protein L0Y71_08955 [Gemmataceae bacterium]|nr:hypothetical protein [Gemmataceae bacterium]
MSNTDSANTTAANHTTFDVEQFRTSLRQATADQKQLVLYWLLRDLCGPRMEQEYGVYDPDEFLYAHVISPGQREGYRLLENPALAEELRRETTEPGVPIRDVLKGLGVQL